MQTQVFQFFCASLYLTLANGNEASMEKEKILDYVFEKDCIFFSFNPGSL